MDRGDVISDGVSVLEEGVELSRPRFDPVTFFNDSARSTITTRFPSRGDILDLFSFEGSKEWIRSTVSRLYYS